MTEVLTIEEAKDFFAEFYGGEHHFPSELKEWGYGWMMRHKWGELATFDHNLLTRLVLMAHEYCYRVSISNHGPSAIRICVHKRTREGDIVHRHPTIQEAIESHNASVKYKR